MRKHPGSPDSDVSAATRACALSPDDRPVSAVLQENWSFMQEQVGHSFDVKFRRFRIGLGQGPEAALIFIDGLTHSETLHRDVMRPLMTSPMPAGPGSIMDSILDQLLLVAEIEIGDHVNKLLINLFAGNTLLFVDGVPVAVIVNAKGWKTRGIEPPTSEANIRGPRDAFTEDILTNVTRMRRRFKDRNLHAEVMQIGRRTGTVVAVVYLRELVNSDVLDLVHDRLKRMDIAGVIESGYIQEVLQGRRWMLFPLVHATERPDRASAALLEGRIVIVTDNTPFVLIVPAVLSSMFQAPADYYHPSPIGTFLRIIRVIGWTLGLFLPGLYVAVSSVNPEILPPDLALTLAASRAGVPYPAIVEVLLMDLAIELLAEASTRLPSVVGGAATLVGGLIIGSAAVTAGVISSTMVVVVAVTAIGLFTIPTYELGLAWRISKYAITLSAAFLGLFGMTNMFIILVIYLSSLSSFGQPYLSPVGPYRAGDMEDFILRAPWWSMRPLSQTFGTTRRQRIRRRRK